ncbi:MAG: Mov34/MPN/PAD-1 family protein [Gemmatimonadaceae bacterium]
MRVRLNASLRAMTLSVLQETGSTRVECVVLWLGRRAGDSIVVTECYRPKQEARADFFRIPPASMLELKAHLRRERLMVAAQVHTHPRDAFHSAADDAWAIIRHEGALSLVLPQFALKTDEGTFADDVKVFRLNARNVWCEVPAPEVDACLELS